LDEEAKAEAKAKEAKEELDKEAKAEAKAKEAKDELNEIKWDAWFAMTLGKIVMAKEDPKGRANRPPPLEIADVRPYVNNPQLAANVNESAKRQWAYRELCQKKAREAQAQTAARLLAEESKTEAEFLRDTLRPSSLEVEEVDAKHGKNLESSFMMAKTGLEMFVKGRTDYVKFDLQYQKDFRKVTEVAVDVVNVMSLADYPQAKAAVLREAGIVPHKFSGQHLPMPHEFGPPTPPTGPPPRHVPLQGSRAAPLEVDPEVVKKPLPPYRTIPNKAATAMPSASSSSTATAMPPASSSSTATAMPPASSSSTATAMPPESSSSSTATALPPASSSSSTAAELRPESSRSSGDRNSDRDSDRGSSRSSGDRNSDRDSDRGSSRSSGDRNSDRDSDRGSSRSSSDRDSNRSSRSSGSSNSSDRPTHREDRSNDRPTHREERSSDRTTTVGSKRSREREDNGGNDNSRYQRVGGKGGGKGKSQSEAKANSDDKSKGKGKGKGGAKSSGERPRCQNMAGCKLRFECNLRHTNAEYLDWGKENAARASVLTSVGAPPPASAVVAEQAPETQNSDSDGEDAPGYSPLPEGQEEMSNILGAVAEKDEEVLYSSDSQNNEEIGAMVEHESGASGYWSR
jgi:hypothetical protein